MKQSSGLIQNVVIPATFVACVVFQMVNTLLGSGQDPFSLSSHSSYNSLNPQGHTGFLYGENYGADLSNISFVL